ncbi:sensor domain-containing protein [Lichenifustis flavocetrariae]|uniref:EAL domain-containing protein n=1 Tax=Lichenifustis flavocetrariae TaxID=2949735 RepID=A0AA42CL83_9HYPH|nr:bifunctional diguanylate cyclase/phosphodiesterase [Lichenifustis flavocetrariae]MCW6507040.1 EAL domain-containing protein [Lichenifustis flavocetrariae]
MNSDPVSEVLGAEVLRRVFESSVDCIKLLDRDGIILLVNIGGAYLMDAADPSQLIGRNWLHFWEGATLAAAEAALASARNGHVGRSKGSAPTLKGMMKCWDSLVTPMRGPGGEVEQILVVSRDVTDLHRLNQELELEKRRSDALVEAIAQVVWHSNADQTGASSPDWLSYCGMADREIGSGGWLEAVHPEDRDAVRKVCEAAIVSGEDYENTYRLRHHSGTWRWVTDRVVPVCDESGTRVEWVGLVMDIHDRVLAEKALRESEERLRLAVQSSRVGIWDVDLLDGTRRWSNELKEMMGLAPEAVEDEALLIERVHPDDRNVILDAHRSTFLQTSGLPQVTFRIIRKDNGEIRWIRSCGHAIADEHGHLYRRIGTWQDLTDSVLAEQRLWHAANHDALTLLANRNRFNDVLAAAMTLAESEEPLGLFLVDLDGFKRINDTLGHAAGDLVLRTLAERLRQESPVGATAARLGGDEFAVVAPGLQGTEEANELAAHLNNVLAEPIPHPSGLLRCTASIGIAIFPDGVGEPSDLLKNADLALYQAKKAGPGQHALFNAEMRTAVAHRVAVLRQVGQALMDDAIAPFYQPKIFMESGEIEGFEALLRWNDGSGWQAPAAIEHAFEDPTLAVQLGERMMDRVIADLTGWRKLGLNIGRIAVNVSAAEFSKSDMANRILAKLDRAGLSPGDLDIEVTESVILGTQATHVGHALRRLHTQGVSIALDDFGTGYASLTHLRQYPFDWLKIDRSFVRDLEVDANADAIVSAVIGLAHGMSRRVVAEGVETVSQLDILRRRGCDVVQGYLVSRPMPASRVPAFTRRWVGFDESFRKTTELSCA